ncbi:sensor histidine kinase [Pseudoclavibacter sp. VKM Ac-2888]|uniref:sensor histidine kinase n=1 Tax=Pseudoclavibacter sp. VKM Ac-2888 TaxID=2783830 RepID=UPI00188C75D4|nr:HAMP domain-containing sensor histidine kinase [Pseudoclavibacter sp. VKM Ac-2888]MBF4548714.1 HAMP domain-containing histidine kinase [Pseudoclavibacter sp. VKM Ac-2888]
MTRQRGLSVRLKLALSYAAFLMIAGALLLAVVYAFLLRYVPAEAMASEWTFFPGRTDLVRAFVPAAAWALLFLLVFALVGGWFLAGRMLAPLTRITNATRAAAAGSLSHRIRLDGRSDEFTELADSFDAMLAQLEAHVAQQQRFAANASHELRTPLAISQTLLDVARRDPGHDHDEVLGRLHSVNARAIELTEALLVLSRTEHGTFATERVDLSLVAEEAAETLLPLAEKRGVAIETEGEAADTIGSPALISLLTTNLLHNAIVHNLPEGGTVRLTTASAPDAATLVVENTGSTVGPELLATLTEPFQRGEQRARSDHAGVGLGLAIVKSVVKAHGGTMRLAARDGGGLRVTVQLPPATWAATRAEFGSQPGARAS